MKKKIWLAGLALTGALLTVGISSIEAYSLAPSIKTSADATTQKVVTAANAFLQTLSSAQKSKVVFDWSDTAQKTKWSNLPTGLFERNGIKLGDMSGTQQTALFALLQVVFSKNGYQQITQVIDSDEVLKSTDGGGRLIFGKAEYFVSFLGTPSNTSPWILQFGGHHMALNATVAGADIVLTPSLTGGQPTTYTLNGKTVQPIIAEPNAASKLLKSLDATQQKQAIIGSKYIDLILGPGKDGKTLQPEGIKGSSLSATQQTLLLDLVETRVGMINDEDAAVKMKELKANIANTYFAWSGGVNDGAAAYFRVTAPTLILEFAPQGMGGSAANHTHSMYRDPTNDYGAKLYK
ncbi:MAG: hypothetical protein RLZZ156_416 [Deinococcota bacterium]|jgi:hypothetical protein